MNKVEVKMDEKTVQYYITSLEDLCRTLQEENGELQHKVNLLESNNKTAINFIDQVLQHHITPFQPNELDEDINTLIGILRYDGNE